MISIRSRIMALAFALLLCAVSIRAEEDEPQFRGKKLSEWIEQLQNGKTLRDRKAGLLALQLIGPRKSRKVTQALIAAVRENTEDTIRIGAAHALGEIAAKARDEDDIPIEKIRDALAASLRTDKKPNVRRACAKALGEMKGRATLAVDVLAIALKDADAGTRTEAAGALRQLGRNAYDALAELQTALRNAKLERLTRLHCADALGQIGSDEAVPSLKEVLADNKSDMELRRACAHALGELGQKAANAVPALASALTAKESNVELRRACAEALDGIGSEARPALTALRTALKDEDQFVRSLSLHAISQMGQELGDERKLAIDGILTVMDDNVLEVRIAAIQALGNLGAEGLGDQNKAVVARLTAATRDPQKAVSEAAKVALKKLQSMP
ncbi:MAG TPA: HEAT repeat domain-containing protein [Gemmataceae bacterium]|nr:HEAT repeat domain-containing protein [Gemmataceae bacterium]